MTRFLPTLALLFAAGCSSDPAVCVPTTCRALDARCGSPPDGCGGSLACGSCAAGACEELRCVVQPDCEGRSCGPDGVGGSCGACEGERFCTSAGTCQMPAPGCPDITECGEQRCGADPLCGESCGMCDEGEACDEGRCVCMPLNCEAALSAARIDCGDVADGCGETLECPCFAGELCRAGTCTPEGDGGADGGVDEGAGAADASDVGAPDDRFTDASFDGDTADMGPTDTALPDTSEVDEGGDSGDGPPVVVLAEDERLARAHDLAVADGVVYVSATNLITPSNPPLGTIYRIEGSGLTPWETSTRGVRSVQILPGEPALYWLCAFGPICRRPFDGGPVVANGTNVVFGDVRAEFFDFVIADEAVFARARIRRVHRTPFGGETAFVATSILNLSDVDADEDYVYWLDAGAFSESNGRLRRADHDGSDVTDLLTGIAFPGNMEVDGDRVFVIDSRADEILSVRRSGAGRQVVATRSAAALEVDAAGFCYVEALESGGGLWCAERDGGDERRLADNLRNPIALFLTSSFVYVLERGTDDAIGRVLRVVRD